MDKIINKCVICEYLENLIFNDIETGEQKEFYRCGMDNELWVCCEKFESIVENDLLVKKD